MDYREELFKALTTGIDGVFRDKSIDALVEVCKAARKEGYNAGLEDGQKQKKSVFKVGDRVRTTGEQDEAGTPLFPVGTIGEVIEVDINYGGCLVKAYPTEDRYYYLNDALELANDVIIVGDEVIYDREKCVVTAIANGGHTIMLLGLGGGYMVRTTQDDIQDKRTGRCFSEIANVLKKMQEGNE